MTRSKVSSDADLQVALLKTISQDGHKRVPVATLLLPSKDVLGSDERQPALPLLSSDRVRELNWERSTIDTLREMYENEGWIHIEYLDENHAGAVPDIEPVVTLENQYRLAVSMTRRGQIFLERGSNPKSRHSSAPSTKSRKGSQRPPNESIADIVRGKERRYRKPKNEAEAWERIAASIAGRRGQREFRQQLLRHYKRCLITGCDAEAVLEAAHIQLYCEEGTFDVSNGLLLRAGIHTLFDLGLITIDPADMSVITAEALKHTLYAEFNGKKLQFPNGSESGPDPKALHAHHQAVIQRQQQAFVL